MKLPFSSARVSAFTSSVQSDPSLTESSSSEIPSNIPQTTQDVRMPLKSTCLSLPPPVAVTRPGSPLV